MLQNRHKNVNSIRLAILNFETVYERIATSEASSTDLVDYDFLFHRIVPIDILCTGHARVETWSQAPISDNRLREELFTAI